MPPAPSSTAGATRASTHRSSGSNHSQSSSKSKTKAMDKDGDKDSGKSKSRSKHKHKSEGKNKDKDKDHTKSCPHGKEETPDHSGTVFAAAGSHYDMSNQLMSWCDDPTPAGPSFSHSNARDNIAAHIKTRGDFCNSVDEYFRNGGASGTNGQYRGL